MSKHAYYSVHPRYTPGSPAQVSEAQAMRVAQEERRAIEAALSGAWGEEHQQSAKLLGLDRIVITLTQHRAGSVVVHDLLTQVEYLRPGRGNKGEVIDVWDPERGWLIRYARVRNTGHVILAEPAQSPWEWAPREFPRDLCRVSSSVRTLVDA